MTIIVSTGKGQAFEGREAGNLAARQALDGLGDQPPVMGWVIADQELVIESVFGGISAVLGDLPLLGFSTSEILAFDTTTRRTVIVALIGGDEVQARAEWFQDFSSDSRACANRLVSTFPLQDDGLLMAAVEGLNGDASHLCQVLSQVDPGKERQFGFAGILAGGELSAGSTRQIGGRQCGSGGLAAAWLTGDVALGVGAGHGWQPVGALVHLSRIQGFWIRSINDRKPAEVYAELFGRTAREWSFAPLNKMVRLYPLGLESEGSLMIRAPLRMEADGSLRMGTALSEGGTAHLLVGNLDACLEAARSAAQMALLGLNGARPLIVFVFTDCSWQMLFQARPGADLQAIRSIFGAQVPLIGGYGYGQLARQGERGPAQLLNQHILVAALGEKQVTQSEI